MIRTPDQRLRVFVSSTLAELAAERQAVRRAVERLRLSPVMFEIGARPHPPRELYRAYLEQSDVFVGIYWQRYGWTAPGEDVSGLEDEYRLADRMPQLIYLKDPAPEREPALTRLLGVIQERDQVSYRRFATTDELEELVAADLALMLSERFDRAGSRGAEPAPPAALPAALTRTIGREQEVAALLRMLDDGDRLVTVTGPGGVGKTRIALEVGRAVAARPGAVVHFVPLAAVNSPSLVLAGVADALGVRGATGRTPLDSLVEHFGDRPAVLVLDNLEQVVEVGSELVRLLERAAGVQVLATSRQALRVLSEREFPVGPLGLPAEGDRPEDVERAPSVELLLERARARGVPLELTEANRAAVSELCRRLGGLPLAIELAVPRLRLLDPAQALARLESTLDLPAAGKDLPSRQRTLRATLTWSNELLGRDERSLLAQLSVFRGGATLEGIEQVCVLPAGDEPDGVETALAGLLDKNLLALGGPTGGAGPRFQMLEPVRDFACEQLLRAGATEEAQERHLEYFLALGREAQPFVCGPRQREWAARLDLERANLRAATETGLRKQAYDAVLRLTWDTLVYYYIRDSVDEPRQLLLRMARQAPGFDRLGQALLDVGLLIVGEPPPGQDPVQLLETATSIFDESGLSLEAAVSRHYLGLQHRRAGNSPLALATLEEASRRYAALAHDWGVANVEMTMGAVHAGEERPDLARIHFEESLRHSRRIDNRHQMAQALQGLAVTEATDGNLGSARTALREAATLVIEDRSTTGATYCLEALAAQELREGGADEAVRLIAGARATRRRRLIPEWTAAADAVEPVLAAARAALTVSAFEELWRSGSEDETDVLERLSSRVAALAGAESLPGALP